MPTIDEHIAQRLRESQREMEQAPSYGKPLVFADGYMETPAELRLAYKALKDAGYVPAEVEMFKQVAALRKELETATGERRKTRCVWPVRVRSSVNWPRPVTSAGSSMRRTVLPLPKRPTSTVAFMRRLR